MAFEDLLAICTKILSFTMTIRIPIAKIDEVLAECGVSWPTVNPEGELVVGRLAHMSSCIPSAEKYMDGSTGASGLRAQALVPINATLSTATDFTQGE